MDLKTAAWITAPLGHDIDLRIKRDIDVKVEQYAPPSERYSAIDRASYDGVGACNIIGRGSTKQAAIRDLLDKLAEAGK